MSRAKHVLVRMDNEIQKINNCAELSRLATIHAILYHPALAQELPLELGDPHYSFCEWTSEEQQVRLFHLKDCCTRLLIGRLSFLQKCVLFWPKFVEASPTCADTVVNMVTHCDDLIARRVPLPCRAILKALALMAENYSAFIVLLKPFLRLSHFMFGFTFHAAGATV